MQRYDYPTQTVPKDRRFCPACGETKKLKYFTLDEEYCDECCKTLRRSHIKWQSCVALVFVLIFAAAAVYVSAVTLPAAKLVHGSRSLAESHRLYDAYDSLESAQQQLMDANETLSTKLKNDKLNYFNVGENVLIRMMELRAEFSTRLDAGARVLEIFDDEQLSKRKYKNLYEYAEISRAYNRLTTSVQNIAGEMSEMDAEDIPYDDIISRIDALVEDDSPDYEKAYVEYYKASVSQYVNGDDFTVPLKHLEKMLEYLPDERELYVDTLAMCCSTDTDRKKLIDFCDKMIANNINDAHAYYRKAFAMIEMGDIASAKTVGEQLMKNAPDSPLYYALMMKICICEKDLEKATEFSDAGDKANRELSDTAFSMYLAKSENIGRLAEDIFVQNITFSRYQTALHLAQKHYNYAIDSAYNNCYYPAYYYAYLTGDSLTLSQEIIDITAICASLAHKDDVLKELSDIGNYSETVKSFINGKTTLDKIIYEGEGDIL